MILGIRFRKKILFALTAFFCVTMLELGVDVETKSWASETDQSVQRQSGSPRQATNPYSNGHDVPTPFDEDKQVLELSPGKVLIVKWTEKDKDPIALKVKARKKIIANKSGKKQMIVLEPESILHDSR